jgi:hypothetical protein
MPKFGMAVASMLDAAVSAVAKTAQKQKSETIYED